MKQPHDIVDRYYIFAMTLVAICTALLAVAWYQLP